MSYAETLIARRRADDALLAKPLPNRIAFLVAMSIMERVPHFGDDARFNEFHGITRAQQWRVMQACFRSDANVSRELLADRLLRSIYRDGGSAALNTALTAAHYVREAAKAAA
jgi:hypothetical protein